jgi:hypothetical protein
MGLNITTPLVQHVGSGLRDKMLTDDMIITNCALDGFDKSLFIMQKVFADGVSVQLHKYAYPSCAHPTSTISAVPSAPIYCHIILNFSPGMINLLLATISWPLLGYCGAVAWQASRL